MMFTTALSAWTLVAVAPFTSAHTYMERPRPFHLEFYTENTGPLTDATQYPCKGVEYDDWSNTTTMAVGEVQTLQIGPGAHHNGGSCQISITLDQNPTANSVFKVIHSIVGNCPLNPTWEFTVPKAVPNRKAVLAWTWFSEQSGDPEMYMNCAPIEITGGASDDTAFNKLPNMLQANYPGAPGDCKKPADQGNWDLIFPDPGDSVETHWITQQMEPTDTAGLACGKTTPGTSIIDMSATAIPNPSISAAAANAGGVFAEGAASAPDSTPAASSTTLLSTTPIAASPSSANNAIAPATTTSVPAVATPDSTTANSGTGDSQTACKSAKDGDLVCNGTSQFGLCNWGKVVWQSVAAGTICENGTIKATKNARAAAEVKVNRAHGHAYGRLSPVGRRFHA